MKICNKDILHCYYESENLGDLEPCLHKCDLCTGEWMIYEFHETSDEQIVCPDCYHIVIQEGRMI
jgi:hypothetical protein